MGLIWLMLVLFLNFPQSTKKNCGFQQLLFKEQLQPLGFPSFDSLSYFLSPLVCLLGMLFLCLFSEKTNFLPFILFIPWDCGCLRNQLLHPVVQSPSRGVTMMIILLPALGKQIFFILEEGVAITLSIFCLCNL